MREAFTRLAGRQAIGALNGTTRRCAHDIRSHAYECAVRPLRAGPPARPCATAAKTRETGVNTAAFHASRLTCPRRLAQPVPCVGCVTAVIAFREIALRTHD